MVSYLGWMPYSWFSLLATTLNLPTRFLRRIPAPMPPSSSTCPLFLLAWLPYVAVVEWRVAWGYL